MIGVISKFFNPAGSVNIFEKTLERLLLSSLLDSMLAHIPHYRCQRIPFLTLRQNKETPEFPKKVKRIKKRKPLQKVISLSQVPGYNLVIILKKLETVPLIRLRQTCRFLNDFIDEVKIVKRIPDNIIVKAYNAIECTYAHVNRKYYEAPSNDSAWVIMAEKVSIRIGQRHSDRLTHKFYRSRKNMRFASLRIFNEGRHTSDEDYELLRQILRKFAEWGVQFETISTFGSVCPVQEMFDLFRAETYQGWHKDDIGTHWQFIKSFGSIKKVHWLYCFENFVFGKESIKFTRNCPYLKSSSCGFNDDLMFLRRVFKRIRKMKKRRNSQFLDIHTHLHRSFEFESFFIQQGYKIFPIHKDEYIGRNGGMMIMYLALSGTVIIRFTYSDILSRGDARIESKYVESWEEVEQAFRINRIIHNPNMERREEEVYKQLREQYFQ